VIGRLFGRLLGLIAFLVLGWLFGRALRGGPPRRGGFAPRPEPLEDGGPMVRDRVCNTFLPRSRALRLEFSGEEQFFCSEACRSAFLERGGPAGSVRSSGVTVPRA
jgi:YHS domain-containing protein